jgi:ABC-2 type transport system ATP-binding protein
MNNILELNNVSKKYEDFYLDNISFHIPKGYIMGLVGPNGAGKTTIIKSIINAININSGVIRIFGLDIKTNEIEIKNRLGFVSDKNYFLDSWTAYDLNFIMKKVYPTWDGYKYTDMLERYNLPANKPINEFSSGMQTRLMLSTILSRNTDLLVLDEPTSGLDPIMRDEFLLLIKEYIKDGEKSVLYSTHITTDLEQTADFITFVNNGRLVFSEETDFIKETYLIVKGGLSALDGLKEHCIGFRVNEFGFEALMNKSKLSKNPDSCISQPASIDEIIVFYNKKER